MSYKINNLEIYVDLPEENDLRVGYFINLKEGEKLHGLYDIKYISKDKKEINLTRLGDFDNSYPAFNLNRQTKSA